MKSKTKSKLVKLPATLLVRMDNDGGTLYPVAFINADDLDDGDKIGVYQLSERREVSKKALLK